MQIAKIISLANKKTELQFLAMCRSLRLTGCDLPIWVIPYDNNKFDLPGNCIWWEIPDIVNWVDGNNLWPAFKKIQCLLTDNYQFVDSDVIFLQNPSLVLNPMKGFITSCTHWNNPTETVNEETITFFEQKSTTWPKLIFNSGQWACDTQLYDLIELIHFCENNYLDTLFHKNYLYKDQAGINLLVNYKNIDVCNLTLPPYNMDSTWAGDYLTAARINYLEKSNSKPYLIHWAGVRIKNNEGIHKYLFDLLDEHEKRAFISPSKGEQGVYGIMKSKIKRVYKIIKE